MPCHAGYQGLCRIVLSSSSALPFFSWVGSSYNQSFFRLENADVDHEFFFNVLHALRLEEMSGMFR